jgi:hypothetical protein
VLIGTVQEELKFSPTQRISGSNNSQIASLYQPLLGRAIHVIILNIWFSNIKLPLVDRYALNLPKSKMTTWK